MTRLQLDSPDPAVPVAAALTLDYRGAPGSQPLAAPPLEGFGFEFPGVTWVVLSLLVPGVVAWAILLVLAWLLG